MDTFKSLRLSLVFAISLLASVLTAPSHLDRPKRSPQTTGNNTAAFNPWSMFGSFAGSSAQAGSYGGGNGGGGSFAGSTAQAASFGGGNGGNGGSTFANSAAQAQSISYGPFSGSFATSEANAGSQSFSGIPAFLQRFFGR
ncbi:hypothetical protein LSTR_LSTR011302 [Laodelphax striatellus]|uniref:Uncharacterized protein n=1 Tax=Laodelphax striatellus TaxID=195883 RepID=A0A482WGA5_LAOST|nr:hypothetical protein LSTR_LSTR011302 [Laodelphax striatellus]